jgi:hypothetical protein
VYEDEYFNARRIRKRKRVKLALASMPIREVKKVRDEYLRPLNQGLVAVGSAITFEEYLNTVYVPTEMPLLASSTQERYGGVLKNYLMPTLGDRCLRELTPVVLQQYISGFKIKDSSGQKTEAAAEKGMTDALERESVDKIRDVLSSSLGFQVECRPRGMQPYRTQSVVYWWNRVRSWGQKVGVSALEPAVATSKLPLVLSAVSWCAENCPDEVSQEPI